MDFNEELKRLKVEKELVRAVARQTMALKSRWCPVAMAWFEKWKEYVDFDEKFADAPRSEEFVQSLHPGAIDNSCLLGFGDELRRGMAEGEDFVLLSSTVYQALKKRYGGGPELVREVHNVGTALSPQYKVMLYPTRCELYYCNASFPEPVKDPESARFKYRYHVGNVALQTVMEDAKKLFPIYTGQTRLWVRDASPAEEQHDNAQSVQDGDSKRVRTAGRKIHSRDVERDSLGFRLLRDDLRDLRAAPRMLDLLRELREKDDRRDCLELIVEHCSLLSPRETDWPRAAHLQTWKRALQPGDLVDAQDRSARWFAARVTDVDGEGRVALHFLGWSAPRFDESLAAHECVSRLACLHTHSENRAAWDENTRVDVCVSLPGAARPVWIPGTVREINAAREQVKVVVSRALREENLKLLSPTPSVAVPVSLSLSVRGAAASPVSSTSSLMDIDDDDETEREREKESERNGDDEAKKRQGVAESKRESDKESDEEEELWLDLYGDAVCPLYTHTARPKTVLKTTSSALNSASSSSSYLSPATLFSSQSSQYGKYNAVSRFDYDANTTGAPLARGVVGLQNLGNTCFMNSILQCLSATHALTQEVFLSDAYKAQINVDNVLGHKGKVALAYAKLLKDMWSGAYCKVVPREFKTTIGESHPQFAGYDQQDSQEFLGFLLDGLHEDLNRVYKKPFVQKIESKGRPDALIAAESLRRFLLRNDSEIVDRAYGLTRSHVTCTQCRRESVKFEAFSSLSLPIPVAHRKRIEVLVALLPLGRRPVRVALEVDVALPMERLGDALLERLRALRVPLSSAEREGEAMREGEREEDKEYELVHRETEREGEREKEEFTLVDKDDALSVSVSPSLSHKHSERETEREAVDASRFQFALSFSTRPHTVFKNYVPAEARAAAVTAFAGKADALLAFQLPRAVAPPRAFPGSAAVSVSLSDAPQKTYCITLPARNALAIKNMNKNKIKSSTGSGSGSDVDKSDTLPQGERETEREGEDAAVKEKNELRSERESEKNEIENLIEGSGEEQNKTENDMYEKHDKTELDVTDVEAESRYFTIDLVVATRETESDKFALRSRPARLCLRENARNADVHDTVRVALRRFLRRNRGEKTEESPLQPQQQDDQNKMKTQESDSEREPPVELLLTNAFATVIRRTVPRDAARFESARDGVDVLVAVCLSPSLSESVWDEREFFAEDESEREKEKEKDSEREREREISVYDCLDKFVERERLAASETIYCSACREHVAPIKKMDVFAAPDVLVLHLKRFQVVAGQGFHHREKIADRIAFPVMGLDLAKYIVGPQSDAAPPMYDLYAVSHHMGGLGGGHYVATVRSETNGKWYNCNDSTVTETTQESATAATAYVLFYKRRTGSLKWGGVIPLSEGLPDDEDD